MSGRPPVHSETRALHLLRRDHDNLRRLFREFDRLSTQPIDDDSKAELVGRICFELTMHAAIEEALFYPAVQAAIGRNALLDLAAFDHHDARGLIAQLDEMEPGDAGYDETVVALGVCSVAHMREEEEHVFAKASLLGVDTAALGAQLAQRQKALRADVTRVGLPQKRAAAGTWPLPCHYARSAGAATPARRSEV